VTPRTAPRRLAVTVVVLLSVLAGCGTGKPGDEAQPSTSKSQSRTVEGSEKLEACPTTPSKPPVSNALPDLTLPCLGKGPDVRLADLRGPMLVNVWAQWCGPCRTESPFLAELYKKAGGKVKLLGIDYDDPRAELAVSFAVEHQLDYPHLVDPDKSLKKPLEIGGPPLTVFIDKAGAQVFVHKGPFTSQQQLDQLVKDKLGVDL
jgi:thiol-disulfide isomerase/thioredoxin